MKWYMQECKRQEIKSVADAMTEHLKIQLKASDDWLW
jgi:hypothetical protein